MEPTPKANVFLSYGRRDASALADRLCIDLAAHGYKVWRDTREIPAGSWWEQEIVDGLRSAQIVIALLSPHAVRTARDPLNPTGVESVCLDEISFARFATPAKPIIPVMAKQCAPPLCIFRLDYVDMQAWQESDEQYQAGLGRLLTGLETALRGEVKYRSWEDDLRPWDFAAYLNDKRRDFCGREWLFDEIDAWRVGCREPALLLTGDPGAGKTAVVARLVHLNPGGQVLAYHCCQSDTPATLEPWRFVRSVAAMIASQLLEYASHLGTVAVRDALNEKACREDPASSFEVGVLTPLEAIPAPPVGVRYILIDALDEALLYKGPLTIVDLLAPKIGRLPQWLRVLATTRKEPDVLKHFRGLRTKELNAQDPRNQDDVARYIRARLTTPNLAERLAAARTSPEVVSERLCRQSDGNFLYVCQALDAVERDLCRFDDLASLPPGLFGIYHAFFRRQFPAALSFREPGRILEAILAAQEPLSYDLILGGTGLSREELDRELRRLRVYLPRSVGPDTVARYAVYHKSLVDWLTDPEQSGDTFSVNPEPGHIRLADVCLELYQHVRKEIGERPSLTQKRQPADQAWKDHPRPPSAVFAAQYAFLYLPLHLIGAKRWNELEDLLTDPSAKLANQEVLWNRSSRGLFGHYRAALAALPPSRPRFRVVALYEKFIDGPPSVRYDDDYEALQQLVGEVIATQDRSLMNFVHAGLESASWSYFHYWEESGSFKDSEQEYRYQTEANRVAEALRAIQ
jgi:hypothetical protein